ncbi:hypothetical protein K1T35_11385 [Pseudonocardia sp. DSM 110487]|uniref:hypothetical protein n=1 Tax=Pseudonocardia sp. DSM 110487 TaxID=2865833 RepID=UPI001C6A1D58|nr:hypothetical protein [Pseudonocardia sp. DSM 110487]QYN37782.1 hypothetical protein K1T35_11385 [Pseudonocardia sp. DSM 110487]
MTKLTVVVTCSDRKSETPQVGLRVRDLPKAGLDVRSAMWRSRLGGAGGARLLAGLYRGESWSLVPDVMASAQQAGFTPRLLVASAGLGLRDANSLAPAYAATFALRQQDSVGETAADLRGWWHTLHAAPGALDPDRELRGPLLLVLSHAYAAAMSADLEALGRRSDDVLLVGGAGDIPGITRLPADRGLRAALGGTSTGLTTRMAHRWLAGLTRPSLTCSARMGEWRTWADDARRDESWARQPLDDLEVLQFIREARAGDPGMSRTRALRKLRDSGKACEQSRFAVLYRRVVSES